MTEKTSAQISKGYVTEFAAIADLKPHPENYRVHGKEQLEHIVSSLKEHGCYRNVVTAVDGTILAGHGVVEACKVLGLKEIPIIRLDMTADDKRALKVLTGDNEISRLGEIDDRKLTDLLKKIKIDLSLMGTGFDDMRLANLVFVTRPETEIKDMNAAREWVGMPTYVEEDPDAANEIAVVVKFDNKEDREKFIEQSGLKFRIKQGDKRWTTYWPFRETNDILSVKFETGENNLAIDFKETIPKRFIRIWLGEDPIPELFQQWWDEFKTLHADYELLTFTDAALKESAISIPDNIKQIYNSVSTHAGRSDILRLILLHEFGGIYVDTDVMPIKSFDALIDTNKPFIAQRSKKSFESAVIGSPKGHPALLQLLNQLPEWHSQHKDSAASVQTGPAFISNYWFGKPYITHLPTSTFYPYNGFMAPKKDEKLKIFADKNFPDEMLAAHFSNHSWGGKPQTLI